MYGLNILTTELPDNERAIQETLGNISSRNYENTLNVVEKSQTAITEYKSTTAKEQTKNNCFIYYGFFELLKSLALYWRDVEAEKYHASWCKLQDALDCLRQLKRFYKEDNITLWFLARQLLSIERVYPYKYFSSCGFIIEQYECSLCSKNIDSDDCPHIKGQLYSGEMAIAIARNIKHIDHLAIVTNPKNKRLVLAPDDSRQEFDLFRMLIVEFNTKKCCPLSFTRVQLTENKRVDPDHKRAPRNSQCYCGSGKKYKNCCIKSERMPHIHMNISLGALIDSSESPLSLSRSYT